jgi:hypothetical protein
MSVLVKSVIELWEYSSESLEECADQFLKWMNTTSSSSSSECFQQSTLRHLLSDLLNAIIYVC